MIPYKKFENSSKNKFPEFIVSGVYQLLKTSGLFFVRLRKKMEVSLFKILLAILRLRMGRSWNLFTMAYSCFYRPENRAKFSPLPFHIRLSKCIAMLKFIAIWCLAYLNGKKSTYKGLKICSKKYLKYTIHQNKSICCFYFNPKGFLNEYSILITTYPFLI